MGVQINGDTGNISATKADYSGNVTIGGTLTYEDVTNIDSVGLVTARSGIEVGARPGVAASISVDGNMIVSGISTFGGDVQVPDKIIHSGDTNTAIRFPAADTITAETGGSERLRIDSGGKLLIGTTSHQEAYGTSALQIAGTSGATSSMSLIRHGNSPYLTLGSSGGSSLGDVTALSSGDRIGQFTFAGADGTDINTHAASIAAYVDGSVSSNNVPARIVFATGPSETEKMRISSDQIDINDRLDVIHNGGSNYIAHFENTNTTTPYGTFFDSPSGAANGYPIISVTQAGATPPTKFRVDSGSGRVYINTDSLFSSEYQVSLYITSTGGIVFRPDGTSTRKPLAFQNNSGTEVGSISNSTGSTSFNTSSDYRLKENEVTIPNAISKVKQLKPYTFNFKADPNTTIDGFFAHEAQEVVPYAVTGEKDAEKMQSIDYGKLTPLLTAALQEAISEIETLKTEVAALKSQLNN